MWGWSETPFYIFLEGETFYILYALWKSLLYEEMFEILK
jgi:hypothetical protein